MKKKQDLPGLFTEPGLTFVWHYLLAHQQVQDGFAVDRNALGFLGHCLAHLGGSKANLLQDLYVTYKLGERRNGYFVEFGAADGVLFSNTFRLEKSLGWTGILAEPYPRWREPLRANRAARIDHRCVWSESGRRLEFVAAHRHPELSSLGAFAGGDQYAASRRVDAEVVVVDTVSLNDLLAEHGAPTTIEYLSVDTEGSELDILRAFDFDRYRVAIVTVEHNHKAEAREGLHRLLTGHGFVRELELFSQVDDWYYHPGRV